MAHDPADSRPRYAEPVSGPDGGAGDARLTAPAASRNSADIAAALLDKTDAMGGHYARGADKSRLWKRIAERGF